MEKHDYLYIIRSKLDLAGYQPFNSSSANLAAEKEIKLPQTGELEAIRYGERLVDIRFKGIFDRFNITDPDQIDAAALSAFYVKDTAVGNFEDVALLMAQERKAPHRLILSFDIYYGADAAAGAVLAAPNSKKSDIGPDYGFLVAESAGEVEKYLGLPASIGDQAELFLMMSEQSLRLKVLLEEDDGKGFILIEEAAKQLRREPNRISNDSRNIPSFLVPEFVTAGANFAVTLYRAIYPVAERKLTELK